MKVNLIKCEVDNKYFEFNLLKEDDWITSHIIYKEDGRIVDDGYFRETFNAAEYLSQYVLRDCPLNEYNEPIPTGVYKDMEDILYRILHMRYVYPTRSEINDFFNIFFLINKEVEQD
ncbi:hypothetical protein KK120_18695 [Virgibacillus dakarensis]|nr:hypothetical protein [Virgibacillus dakarensis]